MAKSPETKLAAKTKVRLKAVYSGYQGNPGPGEVIEIDAVEAARLVEVGAADIVTA